MHKGILLTVMLTAVATLLAACAQPRPATRSNASRPNTPTATSGSPTAPAPQTGATLSPQAITAPNPAPAAPQSPQPASKQQRLKDLLELYRADKITPKEYQEGRAKILSEP